MKFNTILVLVYVFLIINSSILAIKDKASKQRKFDSQSRVSLLKKSHTKLCEGEEENYKSNRCCFFLERHDSGCHSDISKTIKCPKTNV